MIYRCILYRQRTAFYTKEMVTARCIFSSGQVRVCLAASHIYEREREVRDLRLVVFLNDIQYWGPES
jgi:hypothetical protein